MSERVSIWTDGACSGNPGPGGWGAVLRYGTRERELKGGEALTTNNRMELTAAIEALEALKRPCAVSLHTDSQYLRGGVTGWLDGWKRNGWRTADRKPVKNEDLCAASTRRRSRTRSNGFGSRATLATNTMSERTGWRVMEWSLFEPSARIGAARPRRVASTPQERGPRVAPSPQRSASVKALQRDARIRRQPIGRSDNAPRPPPCRRRNWPPCR